MFDIRGTYGPRGAVLAAMALAWAVSSHAQSPSWAAESGQAGAEFGYSVAWAGDVNGNGYDDVLVGAPLWSNGEDREGKVYLYYGSAAGLSPTPGWTWESDIPLAEAGISVASAGDVNGDGYADIIIGAWKYSNGKSSQGAAFVFHGGPDGPGDEPDWVAEGAQVFGFFGISVASAGDVNGDGYDDVVIGAHYHNGSQMNEGAAFVFHGSPTGLRATPSWTGTGGQSGSEYGFAVASAGDVDGDGYDDILVGAPRYNGGHIDEGRAFLYRGSATGISAAPAWTAQGNQGDARMGYSVRGAGDINGNGYADVIVGAPRFNNGQTNEGRAYAYFGGEQGLASTPSWVVESNQEWALFGAAAAGVGDVNGDGFDDVVVGSYWYNETATDEGGIFLYNGSELGLTTQDAFSAAVGQANASFGFSVAPAGDVNGDGYADFIVGAPRYTNGEANEGRAFVFYGSPAGVLIGPAPPVITTDGGNGAGADFRTKIPVVALEGTKGSDGVQLLVNGSDAGVTILSDLTWAYEGPLDEGDNLFVVTTVDANGISSIPDLIVVSLNSIAPPPPVITTDGGNGPGQGFVTNEAAVTLEGTTVSGTAEIRVNGSTAGVSYTQGQTVWSYTGMLEEGANAFSVTAWDFVDNDSAPAQIVIELDTVPPPAPVITTNGGAGPGEDFTTNIDALGLQGTTSNDTVAIRVNGGDFGVNHEPNATQWSFSTLLTPGENIFMVTAFDAAGNESEPATITVELDASFLDPPVISTNGGADFATNQPALVLEGTTAPGTQGIRVNGSSAGVSFTSGGTSWQFSATMSEGPSEYRVTAINGAGRPSYPASITITLDTTPPATPVITTNDGVDFATNEPALRLEGTVDGGAAAVAVDGAQVVDIVVSGNAWHADLALGEGVNAIVVSALDELGNASAPATIAVTLLTVPPAPPVITTDGGNGPGADYTTNAQQVVVEGSAAPGLLEVRVNGASGAVEYDKATGSWAVLLALEDGPNPFEFAAVDVAGNNSDPASITITRAEDSTIGEPAPTTLTLETASGSVRWQRELIEAAGTLTLDDDPGASLAGRVVLVQYWREGELLASREAVVNAANQFSDAYDPEKWGFLEVRARFDGDDGALPAQAGPVAVTVVPSNGADINGDGVVNAIDVQLVINAALGIDISPFDGNVKGHGLVNAIDVQLVINAALEL